MSVAVIHDTKGAGMKALGERLKRLAEDHIKLGVPAGKTDGNGTSLALVAATVEFGHTAVHPDQPERPFLRGGIRAAEPKIRALSKRLTVAVAEDLMSPAMALDTMGVFAAGEIKRYMTGPHFAPNAPSTVAKKGSSQPTIDTAQLKNEITHVVEHGGGS